MRNAGVAREAQPGNGKKGGSGEEMVNEAEQLGGRGAEQAAGCFGVKKQQPSSRLLGLKVREQLPVGKELRFEKNKT